MNTVRILTTYCMVAIIGMISLSSCKPGDDVVTITDYCGDVTTPTTWTNHRSGVDYRVGCVFTITSDMVIEEGTEIEFKDGTGIIIGNGGSLRVKGTVANIVQMHGTTSNPGSWRGLWFESNSSNNELTYCTITGGGQASFNGHDIKANVRLESYGKLAITNTTISNSARDGLYVTGTSDNSDNPLRAFSNNTFSNNAAVPVTTIAGTIQMLDGAASTYTGNGKAYIEIRGGNLFGIHIWKKNPLPYYVTDIVRSGYYGDEGYLTIQAGVAIKFASATGMTVGEYSIGHIRMEGTPAEHISLSSADGAAWKGICIQSTNTQNLFSYVDIDKGGASSFTGATGQKGNIVIGGYSAGYATIQNCSITHSAAYGIYVTAPSNTPTRTGVTYMSNASGDYYEEP